MIVQQTLHDNVTIGQSILNLVNKSSDLQNGDFQKLLQESCDLIQLPNNGYICAVDSSGALVAAPGLKPGKKATLLKANFVDLKRDSVFSFRSFFDASGFEGYYEYPHIGYSDIISTVDIEEKNVKLLVHQNNKVILKRIEQKVHNYYLLGFVFSIIVSFAAYALVNYRVTRYQHELNTKNKKLTETNQQLIELGEEKDLLTGVMAHDLKTPLANIAGVVSIVKEMGLNELEQHEMLELLQVETQRGLSLIEDIMMVRKLESTEYLLSYEFENLLEFWNEFINSHKTSAERKNIRLNSDTPGNPTHIKINRIGVERILHNLVSNAIKFTAPGKAINISFELDNETLCFSVCDQGPGISELELPQLFKKFTKLSARPTGEESSTGLGLYSAKLLATKMGGDIKVESKLGHGSIFTFFLPVEIAETIPFNFEAIEN